MVVPLFAVLIATIASDEAKRGIGWILNCAPVRWLGTVSYSVYLSHLMVVEPMERTAPIVQERLAQHLNLNWIGLLFVFLTVAIVLAISQLTYKWIELPFQNSFRDLAKNFSARAKTSSVETSRIQNGDGNRQ
jgi:peptidoglycan/LPS O-acetylase OafA/YrhL